MLYYPGLEADAIRIVDATGKAWRETSLDKQSVDVSGLPAGLYFISIRSGERFLTQYLMKR
ncbi:MAG: T9SS type A sorting domain-containing protein [Lewinellaceae bacterium]|nr:T9SS type A sorting domain-containing protein [Lewinellaceae bacterium]